MAGKKKYTCVALGLCLTFASLTGCNYKTNLNDAESLKVVQTALDNLKSLNKTYEVSNVMQAPDGSLCYVEICKDGASYTEYPIDKDGNYGTIAFQDADDTDYILTDWVTSNGKGYTIVDDNAWAYFPDDYSKRLQSRNVMYFDTILDSMESLKFKEKTTADIGMGDEEINIYTAKLNSNTVHSLLGLGSEAIYESIRDSTKDDNIKKLCSYYLDDIGFTMVFSDANLTIGVVDNLLRYVQIETGGLGSKLRMTRSIMLSDVDVRQEPDFSNAVTYESTLKEMADYVSNFNSYDEAMKALKDSSETSENSDETN